jgi:hypothetical protein
MRYLNFSHISAIITAMTFMFSGYLIAVINLTTTLAAAIWFPLVFIFYDLALKKRKLKFIILCSVFLGIMFLGGEPTPLFSTVFILFIYSFVHWLSHRKETLRIPLIFVSVLLIFILLFSFQILPFVELIKLSDRNFSQFENMTHWSFPPRDIVNFILPYFYGSLHLMEENELRQDWMLLLYLGVIPIILFLISFVFRRDDLSNFFKIIFLFGLVFIFGRFTPIYNVFYKFLPVFNLIRYPIKFFFLNAISFSFLSGAGWQEYCERIKKGDRRLFRVVSGIFIASFLSALLFLTLSQFKDQILDKFDTNSKYFTIFSVNFYNFKRALVFFILGSLLLYLGARKKIKLVAAGSILIALIFVDLYGSKNIEVNPAVPKKVLHARTPNIDFLKEDKGMFRVYVSSQMNKLNEVLKGATYEEALLNSADNLCSNRLIEHGIYDARGYLSIHNLNYSKVMNLADTTPLPSSTNILNMLNVKYILTPKEIDDKTCKLAKGGKESFLYENLNVLPRAYLVPDYIVLKDELEIANKLKSKEFEPQKLVILEEEPVINPLQASSRKPQAKTEKKEYVGILKYEPNEVVIEANVLDEPKFLVLADNYYPGWNVFVDDKPDKIYKANFTLRAAYLAPGIHTVRFIFSPSSFKIGVLISLVTILFFVIIKLGHSASGGFGLTYPERSEGTLCRKKVLQ